ncbi:MAG: threonine/serine exporter family protein [Clostridiaceae bacterium]|jgi:uncharacterized membrane protein YjjP (DUF1212 family)|nr:threonine/serine exporter family protein [Clostridiaceae bacterium]
MAFLGHVKSKQELYVLYEKVRSVPGGVCLQTTELMNIALKAGEIMLTSGAEIYRVEETIVRICNSYDFKCESFVLPTGIFISIENEDGSRNTGFRRIHNRKVDLNRIDSVNSLSRSLQAIQPVCKTVLMKLIEINEIRQYSFHARIAATALGSFSFTLLFQGSFYDGIAALFIGSVSYLSREILARMGSFHFLENFITGIIAGFLSIAAYRLYPSLNEYKIIIGSIMLYLPGVSITNSIKDALYGDLVASLTRLGEAVLLVTVLAAGVGIALSFGVR